MIDQSKISALRVELNDWYDLSGQRFAEVFCQYKPSKFSKKAWIPQTLGDQIWILYEFDAEQDRLNWESTLPMRISKYLSREVIEYALPYGWHIRDVNGFY